MNKFIKQIAIVFSLSILMAGCNGKDVAGSENVITDQEISESEIVELPSDNAVEDIADIPDIPSNDSSEEADPEIVSNTEFNYDDVDTKGLSEETLYLFAPCAIYLENGNYADAGDHLSSKEWDDIREFLFYFINTNNECVEFVHDYDGEEILTKQWRIKYEDWEYLLREVLNETNPQNVRDKMLTEFRGEMDVYYSPEDNYIYKEVGTIGWGYEDAKVREVNKEGDAYIITYDLYSDFSDTYAPYRTVLVTISESDNKYGYSLVSIETEEQYDAEKIREFLAAKYSCTESPFYTVFDHIDEDGIYVYHIFESVVDETGSHTSTIDWVYVNPKTGEATTFFDEEFNIAD